MVTSEGETQYSRLRRQASASTADGQITTHSDQAVVEFDVAVNSALCMDDRVHPTLGAEVHVSIPAAVTLLSAGRHCSIVLLARCFGIIHNAGLKEEARRVSEALQLLVASIGACGIQRCGASNMSYSGSPASSSADDAAVISQVIQMPLRCLHVADPCSCACHPYLPHRTRPACLSRIMFQSHSTRMLQSVGTEMAFSAMQLQDELQVAYVQEFYQVRLPSRLLQGMFLHGEVPAACSAMITQHVIGCLQTVRDKCFGECSCACLADLTQPS